MYRGWTQTDYQNKHYNINQKDEGTLDDRGRNGGTNFILRIKEQETRLTLQEHDDDDNLIWVDLAISVFSNAQNTTRKQMFKNTMKLPAVLKWLDPFYCLAFLNKSRIIDLVAFLKEHTDSYNFSQKPSHLITNSASYMKLLPVA